MNSNPGHSLILDYGIRYLDSAFFISATWIAYSNRLRYSWFQTPGPRISEVNSWILDSKSKNLPHSGIWITLHVPRNYLCIPVKRASAFPRVTFDRNKEQEYRPRSSRVTFLTKRTVHPSDWPQELGGDISSTMRCFSFCLSSFSRNSHLQVYKWDVKWGTFFALQTKVVFVPTVVSDGWPEA